MDTRNLHDSFRPSVDSLDTPRLPIVDTPKSAPVGHLDGRSISRRNSSSSGEDQVVHLASSEKFSGYERTRASSSLSSSKAVTVLNIGKALWAGVCTTIRVVTLPIFLLGLGMYHAGSAIHTAITKPISAKSLEVETAGSSIKLANQVGLETIKEIETPKIDQKLEKKVKKEMTPEGVKLEELKDQARKDPIARKEYFDHYSENVETMFTANGVKGMFGNDAVDPKLVKLSRESYVNLNLVYRFDGPNMVGRELTLIDVDKDGNEVAVPYKVDRYFEDKDGLVGYGLKPKDDNSTAAPRLMFRGTKPKDAYVDNEGDKKRLPGGVDADVARDIGKAVFDNQSDEITDWLREASKNGERKAFVSGHSLGGALAQRTAALNPDLVGEVFTLNSPAVEKSAFKTLPEYADLKINHVVMTGDSVVPKVGGGRFSRGALLSNGRDDNVVSVEGGSHTSKKLNDYCMRGSSVSYHEVSTEVQAKRGAFFSDTLNYLRPNIKWAQ